MILRSLATLGYDDLVSRIHVMAVVMSASLGIAVSYW